MGRLDVAALRYVSREEMRVLRTVEVCMRNHELVCGQLVAGVARLRAGGSQKLLRQLVHRGVLAHERGRRYDGYRLTRQGYDYLALDTLVQASCIEAFGAQIGTGKESDVYTAYDTSGGTVALKFHRLGRNSFRRLRLLRDYHANRRHISWLYVSSLSAAREYAFMRALHSRGVPVPQPLGRSRHAVVMSLVEGFPLSQWAVAEAPATAVIAGLHSQCMQLMVRLAELGLVHCDFNEFNLMVVDDSEQGDGSADDDDSGGDDEPSLVLIDLPQMVSTTHPNAKHLFDRDVKCLSRFFARRFNFHSDDVPSFDDIVCLDNVYAEVRSGEHETMEESGDSDEESVCGSADEEDIHERVTPSELDLADALQNVDLVSQCGHDIRNKVGCGVSDKTGAVGEVCENVDGVSAAVCENVDGISAAVCENVVGVSAAVCENVDGVSAAVCENVDGVSAAVCENVDGVSAAVCENVDGVSAAVCENVDGVSAAMCENVDGVSAAVFENVDGVSAAVCENVDGVSAAVCDNVDGISAAVCENVDRVGDRESYREKWCGRSVNTCSVAESTIDARVLERRLRQQAQRKRRQQLERVKTKGDASAVSRGRRNNATTLRESLDAVWCDGL